MSKVNTKTRSCLNRSFRRWIFKSNQCKWISLVRTPGIDQPQHFKNWYMQNVSTSNCTWFVTEVNVNVNTYTKWVLGFVCRNSVRLFKIRQTLCCSTFGCFTFIEYFNVHCVAAVQNLRMFSLECSNFLFGCSRTINKSVKIIHTYTHAHTHTHTHCWTTTEDLWKTTETLRTCCSYFLFTLGTVSPRERRGLKTLWHLLAEDFILSWW